MQDNTLCHTDKFVKTFISGEYIIVKDKMLWRMFGSYYMKELRKRIQEMSKNYWLILKENGRKYLSMNKMYYFVRVARDVTLLLKVKAYKSITNEL